MFRAPNLKPQTQLPKIENLVPKPGEYVIEGELLHGGSLGLTHRTDEPCTLNAMHFHTAVWNKAWKCLAWEGGYQPR